jgi:hypothetical protein
MSQATPHPVSFITVQERPKDLIVSFALTLDDGEDIASLTLFRTPVYEPLRPPEEHGVSVWHELHPEIEDDRIRRIQASRDRVEITTTQQRRYILDVSGVNQEEMRNALKVLRKMNFDRSFELDSTA